MSSNVAKGVAVALDQNKWSVAVLRSVDELQQESCTVYWLYLRGKSHKKASDEIPINDPNVTVYFRRDRASIPTASIFDSNVSLTPVGGHEYQYMLAPEEKNRIEERYQEFCEMERAETAQELDVAGRFVLDDFPGRGLHENVANCTSAVPHESGLVFCDFGEEKKFISLQRATPAYFDADTGALNFAVPCFSPISGTLAFYMTTVRASPPIFFVAAPKSTAPLLIPTAALVGRVLVVSPELLSTGNETIDFYFDRLFSGRIKSCWWKAERQGDYSDGRAMLRLLDDGETCPILKVGLNVYAATLPPGLCWDEEPVPVLPGPPDGTITSDAKYHTYVDDDGLLHTISVEDWNRIVVEDIRWQVPKSELAECVLGITCKKLSEIGHEKK